jgi:predicted dehydrogenase
MNELSNTALPDTVSTVPGTQHVEPALGWQRKDDLEEPRLRSLIVGLGRAGAGLHLPVLSRMRDAAPDVPLAGQPFVGYDPRGVTYGNPADDLILVDSLAHARSLLDPESTVVHLCTLPDARADVLADLATAEFRQIIVEKPLAADVHQVQRIRSLCAKYHLRLQVVAPWLASALTTRLVNLVRSGELGALRSISVVQRKPRFAKSLTNAGHPTAFDVEIPHSLPVALRLAGDARVTSAACTDMGIGEVSIRWMGTARLTLQHVSGAITEIFSSMVSPSRERRIVLRFDEGRAVGYYPESQADNFAQLHVVRGTKERSEIFLDDTLAAYFRYAYRRFAYGEVPSEDFELQARAVSLIGDAKKLSRIL